MPIAIKVENLSKAYQLGEIGTGTLSNDLKRWAYKVRGKEDPFLKIGETNDRTTKGESNMVWSLKDLNFEIEQGDAVGIIGRNGAGKSTLLKILSRVTSPTTGNIKVKGRVASLLEVGTGFHPELTGRENIFLNGAILGMRKAEIKKHFDAIVDFSGVERYIDTPVKRYSSGMYVRLAFAVAAHLESEILVVDEVLAVGDAEFQKKCLGKMNDMSKGEGRTVLFVSHNMGSISKLCLNTIMLENGITTFAGPVLAGIDFYQSSRISEDKYVVSMKEKQNKPIYFTEIECIKHDGTQTNNFLFRESILLELSIQIRPEFTSFKSTQVGIAMIDRNENRVFSSVKYLSEYRSKSGNIVLTIKLPSSLFAPGNYKFLSAIHIQNQQMFDLVEDICPITIIDDGTDFSEIEGYDYGSIIINPEWYA